MKAPQTCELVQFAAEHIEDVFLIDRLCFTDPWLKRSFLEELSAPCALNLAAVSPDAAARTLGYCLARVIADECTITRLAVHPGCQRVGIATRLLKKCLHRAGSLGASKCFIEVRAGNTAAQRLYQGFGFIRIGLRSAYYTTGAEDAIVMKCAINAVSSNEPVQQE